MNERTVSLRGGKFAVELLEAGAGDDVLFLPGAWGLSWDPFLEGLLRQHHVIAPRMPGTGNSSGLQHLADHHDLFFFYLELLDELGLDRLALMGHSVGGWIAAELAALEPKRVAKLVLINPLGLWNDGYPVLDFLAMAPDEIAEAAFHDLNHPAAQKMSQPPPDQEAVKLAAIERAKNFSAAARFLWPIPDRGLKKRIHRIQAPTLILWGRSDRLAPVRYADDFQRLIPGSRAEIVEGAGHMPQVEQAEATLDRVSRFLDAAS